MRDQTGIPGILGQRASGLMIQAGGKPDPDNHSMLNALQCGIFPGEDGVLRMRVRTEGIESQKMTETFSAPT